MATPLPTAFTWALSGSAVAPAAGLQDTGWGFQALPPSDITNWLQQQGARAATYIATNFADIDGVDHLVLGLASPYVGLRASDDGSTATFHFDGSSGGLETLVRADAGQLVYLLLGGGIGGATTLRLETTTPGTVGAGGADASVLRLTPELGSVRGILAADIIRPLADDTDLAAAGIPLDAGISLTNWPKAMCRVRLQYTTGGGVVAPAVSASWNASGATYDSPTNTIRIPVDDATAGTIQGLVFVGGIYSSGGAGFLPCHLSVSASYNAGAQRIEVVPLAYRSTATAGWQPFSVPSGVGVDYNVSEYITLMLF